MKKIKLLFAAAGILFLSQNTMATTHTILVGQSGLTFSPSSIPTVVVGDIIHFQWVSGSHTTTSGPADASISGIPTGATTWNASINSTSTSFDYTVVVEGTYNYICNFHVGSGMKGSFVVGPVTSIVTGTIYNSTVVSPNPATDQIQLQFNSDRSFNGTILIFDQSGNEKREEKVKVKSGDNTLSFNISRFTKGMYVINLVDDNETSLVAKKFIKE